MFNFRCLKANFHHQWNEVTFIANTLPELKPNYYSDDSSRNYYKILKSNKLQLKIYFSIKYCDALNELSVKSTKTFSSSRPQSPLNLESSSKLSLGRIIVTWLN